MFGYCIMEVLGMRWHKRDMRKTGIALAGTLLLLVLMVRVPVSRAGAHERASGLVESGTVTVQTTPTEDATVTALNKEKLAQEVQQLKNQNEPSLLDWLRGNLSVLLLGLGALAGFLRWLADRRDAQDKELKDRQAEREKRDEEQGRWWEDRQAEREKRAEERFQSAVEGLGSEREEAKIGGAILLRTFLRSGYEQFYIQTFDLAVAHLRLPRTSRPSEDPNAALPLTTLRQALITVFQESFPLARGSLKKLPPYSVPTLNAMGIQLDDAYLREADLKQVWMPQASLCKVDLLAANLQRANLMDAKLTQANLLWADLSGAKLRDADLSGAELGVADLTGIKLGRAKLSRADLSRAKLGRAKLMGIDLTYADLSGADLRDADLSGTKLGLKLLESELMDANLRDADLSGANLRDADLSRTNLEEARSLKDTDLRRVKGLTKKQREACKAKGAIIDEAPMTRAPVK